MVYYVHHNNMRYIPTSIAFSFPRDVFLTVFLLPFKLYTVLLPPFLYLSLFQTSRMREHSKNYIPLAVSLSKFVDNWFSEANKRHFDASHRLEHLYSLVVAHSILIYLRSQYDFLLWPKM